jgi:hypothetical protein
MPNFRYKAVCLIDLCFNPTLSLALSGVENSAAFSNFRMIYEKFFKLIPGGVIVPGYLALAVNEPTVLLSEALGDWDESLPTLTDI